MTICLSMIVKNEAHCIEKCLESVKPYIDYWIICDTGSTDNTEEVITKCMEGIPGEVHHREWKDFATNRNQALELAKDKADYTLIIDADDYLVVETVNPFKSLNGSAYNIDIKHANIIYHRIQLINNFLDFKYIGVLHEYLELPPNIQPEKLRGCHIFFGASGSRSKDPQKYLRDAEVFEKALLEEPGNSRHVFYCAQSYRDAGEWTKAINYYTKRSEMGGWDEEVFVSLLEAAKLTERLRPHDFHTVESAYLKAYNKLPSRAESLCYLASYCRRRHAYDKAYFFANLGSNIHMPEDGLFVEHECYSWRIHDELAIAAYYIGKVDQARFINSQLLGRQDLSEQDKQRIADNLQFCK